MEQFRKLYRPVLKPSKSEEGGRGAGRVDFAKRFAEIVKNAPSIVEEPPQIEQNIDFRPAIQPLKSGISFRRQRETLELTTDGEEKNGQDKAHDVKEQQREEQQSSVQEPKTVESSIVTALKIEPVDSDPTSALNLSSDLEEAWTGIDSTFPSKTDETLLPQALVNPVTTLENLNLSMESDVHQELINCRQVLLDVDAKMLQLEMGFPQIIQSLDERLGTTASCNQDHLL